MKEKLYTIPVNESFDNPCECPLCHMKKVLEENAIEFTMGPSYMEDDVRMETDKIGFCQTHLSKLYVHQNRLGLALILKTHMDKTITDIEKLSATRVNISSPSLFKKKATETSALKEKINFLEHSCYICNKIENTFDRYVVTIFTLYQSDSEFRDKFHNSKGFCTTHYGLLYDTAPNYFKAEKLQEFHHRLNKDYIDNMKRVRDDLDWFIDKFDYRYADEPWKNSKDALLRAMTKTNSIF